MRILASNYKKGVVKLVPENLDDLWHLYNLIFPGDLVYARTTREVKQDSEFGRPKKGKRIMLVLGVRAKDVSWDRSLNRLRVRGLLVDAPEDIAGAGSWHTLNIGLGESMTVAKEKGWAGYLVERLERASKTATAPVVIVCIDDEEFCVAVMRQFGVDVKVEQKVKLPGKREAEGRYLALHKAFVSCASATREVWQSTHGPIAVLGLGFVKDDFMRFLRDEASDVAEKVVEVKSVHSSGVAGIHEALRSGVLTTAFRHARVAEETLAVEEVLKRLGMDRRDVAYGFDDVEKANGYGAVETLLVTDTMLRGLDDEKRLALEELMKSVEEKGGKIVVVSAEHEAGEKLQT